MIMNIRLVLNEFNCFDACHRLRRANSPGSQQDRVGRELRSGED